MDILNDNTTNIEYPKTLVIRNSENHINDSLLLLIHYIFIKQSIFI